MYFCSASKFSFSYNIHFPPREQSSGAQHILLLQTLPIHVPFKSSFIVTVIYKYLLDSCPLPRISLHPLMNIAQCTIIFVNWRKPTYVCAFVMKCVCTFKLYCKIIILKLKYKNTCILYFLYTICFVLWRIKPNPIQPPW